MALGIVAPATHVDDLEPYRQRHRVLGFGIVVGGIATGIAGGAYFGLTNDVPATVAAASLGILVAAAGLLHMTVGASVYQGRMARRLLRPGRAARPAAAPVES